MTNNIIVADRQFLTREAVRKLLNQSEGAELIIFEEPNKLWKQENSYFKNIDVVFLQVEDKDISKIKNIKLIQQTNSCKFILLIEEIKTESAKKLFDLGLKYIITKQCSEEEILNAYKATQTENSFYCNNVLNLFSKNNKDDCDPTTLTPRELEIVNLITKGLKTNDIAEKLCLSIHTINSHRKNILKKLNLKSPAELIIYAIDSGLVSN